jgi:glycosyltransferase involved in cell wall biosynthesis
VPRISLIIPTHSRPHLLPAAVSSGVAAGGDVEVVVVDDASTDGTGEVCRSLPHIRYVRLERNLRVAGARNAGIEASTAPYIAFLDDDDLRLPGSLDDQVQILEREPRAGVIHGQAYFGDPSGAPTDELIHPYGCEGGDLFWKLVRRNRICPHTAVFRRECLERVGMMDPAIPGIDDWDLWVRIAEQYPILANDNPVAVWRRPTPGSGQGSSDMSALFRMALGVHQRKWMRLPRALAASTEERSAARREFLAAAADELLWDAGRFIASAPRQAHRYITTALALRPRLALRPGIVLRWLATLGART